jgi:hypothetical protein
MAADAVIRQRLSCARKRTVLAHARDPAASHAASAGSAITRRRAQARAAESPGGTSSAASGETVSGIAPAVVAIRGRPCAIASAKLRLPLGRQREVLGRAHVGFEVVEPVRHLLVSQLRRSEWTGRYGSLFERAHEGVDRARYGNVNFALAGFRRETEQLAEVDFSAHQADKLFRGETRIAR